MTSPSEGRKDAAHIDRDWVVDRRLIDGVKTREVRNVVTANGITTELYRLDWGIVEGTVQQAIHVALRGEALSAWHQHRERWDFLFVVGGHIRVVLYDPREESPTRGQVDVFHLSPARPMLLTVPPRVWHGVQNLSRHVSCFVNMFDRPYDYGNPDEWRLPADTPESPTASASDGFVLTLWTDDPGLARQAELAGVQRIGVDLERFGKAERQRRLATWISPHTEDDLLAVGHVLDRAQLFARVNPLHDGSARQVEAVVAAGARVLMLPMVASAAEAAQFVELVAGRALVVLLVERREALDRLSDLIAVDGVDEVHIGLNDLALSLGLRNRWLVLAGDLVADVGARVREAGLRFGFGGIGRVGDEGLPIPSDLVYAEYTRTGATSALVSRSFYADGGARDFPAEIARARQRLAEWHASAPHDIAAAHAELGRRARQATGW